MVSKLAYLCFVFCLYYKLYKLFILFFLKLYDFAQLSGNSYFVYNDIEHFKDEPHSIKIECEEDAHVTEEVYNRPVFLLPSYR